MKMRIKSMTSFFIVCCQKKMLRSDGSINVFILFALYEFCHLTSRYMLDYYFECWKSLSYTLSKHSKLTFSSMDKSFGNISKGVFHHRCFRMQRKYHSTFDHRLKYHFYKIIIWIYISSRTSRIRSDSPWIVFHCSNFSSTCIYHIWCRCWLQ